jgi:hypothetical protein
MTVQMNHGTGGTVTLQAAASGSGTVTIPASTGTLALGGPAISFNSAGTVLSGSGATVSEVSTGIYDITRTTAAANANYGVVPVAWTDDLTAVACDGSNDHIATPITTALGNAYSYCCWVKFTATQTGGLISKRTASGGFYQSSLYIAGDAAGGSSGTKFVLNHNSSSGNRQIISTSGYGDNTWHHVAVTHSGSQTDLYVDGVSVANSTATTGSLTATDSVFIAALSNGASVGGVYYNGSMRDVRLWIGTTLTSGEVASVMANQSVGTPTFWYPLSTGSGTTATDASGNGNAGTLVNGPTWATSAGAALNGRPLSRTTTVMRIEFRTPGGVLTTPSEASISMLA